MKKSIKIFLVMFLLSLCILPAKASTPASWKANGPDEVTYEEVVKYNLVVDKGTLFSEGTEYILDYDKYELEYVSFTSKFGVSFDKNTKKLIFPSGGLQVTVGQEIGVITFKVIEALQGTDVGFSGKVTKLVSEKKIVPSTRFVLDSPTEAKVGDTITFDFKVNGTDSAVIIGAPVYIGYVYMIHYDSDVLEFISFNSNRGVTYEDKYEDMAGYGALSLDRSCGDSCISKVSDNPYGVFKFKIKDSAKLGASIIAGPEEYLFGEMGNPINNYDVFSLDSLNTITIKSKTATAECLAYEECKLANNDFKFYIIIGGMFVVVTGLLIYIVLSKKSKIQ